MQNLEATPRSLTGKGPNRRLRAQGMVPVILYGGAGEAAVSLAVPSQALRRILTGEHRRNTLVGIALEGAEVQPALLGELQYHPVTRAFIHADFIRVPLDKPVTVAVPVVTTGRSKGVVVGGRLRIVRRSVEVSCLPTQIPTGFAVDVTDLDGGDAVRFSECPSVDGIEKVYRNDFVVVQCLKGRDPKLDEVDEPLAEAPEVEEE